MTVEQRADFDGLGFTKLAVESYDSNRLKVFSLNPFWLVASDEFGNAEVISLATVIDTVIESRVF